MKIKAIILGGDRGITNGDNTPKIFKSICGIPIIQVLINCVEQAGISDIHVVVGQNAKNAKKIIAPHKVIHQTIPLGTGHAVLCAQTVLTPFDGCVIILFGDTPLIKPQTLRRMIERYQQGADVTVLGFIPSDTRRYGRLIMGKNGLEKIVEYKEASDKERTIKLCNSGVLCINGQHILSLIQKIKNDNAAGEYYITDIVKIAKEMGLKTDIVISCANELHGINSEEELKAAEELFLSAQERSPDND